MFLPETLTGKLFRFYLKSFSHPAKVRIQNILGRTFRNGIKLKNKEGLRLTLDANDWITRAMLIEGSYENGSTSLAKKLLSGGGTFVDVGANFGLFSCIAAHRNNDLKVIAIEPNHLVLKTLLQNINTNDFQNNVQVINTAVLKKTQQLVTLEQPVSNNLGTTVVKERKKGLLYIFSCSLEYIFQEKKLSTVDLLKIDIEGNEFDCLEFFPFHKYHIKNIILEYNSLSKISLEAFLSFFAENGFEAFTIAGNAIGSGEGILENNIWFRNKNKYLPQVKILSTRNRRMPSIDVSNTIKYPAEVVSRLRRKKRLLAHKHENV